MDDPNLRVSQLTTYNRCPRKIYFEQKQPAEIQPKIQTLFLKELSHRLPDRTIGGSLTEEELLKIFCEISRDIPDIYPRQFENRTLEELDAFVREMDSKTIVQGLNQHIKKDVHTFLTKIRPHMTEPALYSTKHNLAGTPNKIIKIEDELLPSIIKTGKPPENGVWQQDRLLLTGYALLIEDNYQTIVNHGIVEYLQHGTVRETKIGHKDRRNTLQILKKIQKIHQKQILPEKPEKPPCETCNHNEKCNITPDTLSSKFF